MLKWMRCFFTGTLLIWGSAAARADSMIDTALDFAGCNAGCLSGPYIGANIGGGKIDADNDVGPDIGHWSSDDSSVIAGVQGGYNVICGGLFAGVEADFNYINFDATARDGDRWFESQMDWFGTVRGRLGVMVGGTVALYGTGGFAYADLDRSYTNGDFNDRHSTTATGWTAGGGIEYFGYAGWSLRAEGLFVDLGDDNRSYETPSEPLWYKCYDCAPPPPKVENVSFDNSFWVARIGVNYLFNAPPPVVPLK